MKIFFKLDPTDWHGLHSESLWAEPVESQNGETFYMIRNSPFYSRDVSYMDIVKAVPGDYSPALDFREIIDLSGHSTYRVIVQQDGDAFKQYWDRLEKLGCTYESGKIKVGIIYSIDVPRNTNIYDVYTILMEGQTNEIWIFEEGHVGHKLNSPSRQNLSD